MSLRFAAGVVVGTLFGRTIVRTATRVVPKSVRDKMYDKLEEKTTAFVQRRVESALSFVDRKLDGKPRSDEQTEYGPYRRSRR